MIIIKAILIVFLLLLDFGCIKCISEKKEPAYAYWFWLIVFAVAISLLLN